MLWAKSPKTAYFTRIINTSVRHGQRWGRDGPSDSIFALCLIKLIKEIEYVRAVEFLFETVLAWFFMNYIHHCWADFVKSSFKLSVVRFFPLFRFITILMDQKIYECSFASIQWLVEIFPHAFWKPSKNFAYSLYYRFRVFTTLN